MKINSQRSWWISTAVIGCLLLVTWWGARATVSYHSALRCCVQDPGTGGGLGVYLWAQKLNFPIRILRDPLWEAVRTVDSKQGNCFLTAGDGSWSPWEESLSPEQWGLLRRWISRGNTLILVTTNPGGIPNVIADDVLQPAPNAVGAPSHDSHVRADRSPLFGSTVAADPQVASVDLTGLLKGENRGHESLVVRADGPRWLHTPQKWETAGDARGTVWHRAPLGDGAIYILLDDFAWTNSGFERNGNAAALASLLAREVRGGVFGFDEYRHGHGRVESFANYLLNLPGAASFCWMAVLLAVVYVLGRNIRFGPAETFPIVERRSAREYVEAVAYLNQRARAAPLAVESIVRRLRYLSLQRGRSTPELEDALRQAEQFALSAARPANPSDATALVRKLIALRKQCYGS